MNTYQSSSVSRDPALHRPRSSHLNGHRGDFEPGSDMFGRLRRLNTIRLELEEVGKSLSVTLMHNHFRYVDPSASVDPGSAATPTAYLTCLALL